jgi:diguanylate cyclase (GGDEF)-like protein
MCDIDHFKQVNDGHGHQTGDEVLSEFGERLRVGLRLGQDWLARVGGEEFAIVLPETSEEESLRIAERLRERIRATPFRTRSSTLRMTASFGVCAIKRRKRNATGIADALIHAADSALYESKRAGRDRVTTGSTEA